MDTISHMILEIHRAAREMPTQDFQGFILGLVRSLVPFDSSRWVSIKLQAQGAVTNCAYLVNEPADIVLDWDAVNRQDKLMHAVVANPGKAFGIHSATFFAGAETAEMRDYTQRYNHANSLCIASFTATPQHVEGLTLYRAKQDEHFDAESERALEQLMPHMVEALTTSRVLALAKGGNVELAPEKTATAVANPAGCIDFAGSGFGHLLRLEWPHWSWPKLPKALQQALGQGAVAEFVGNAIRVGITRIAEAWFLKASRLSPLHKLTARELAVGQLFSRGHTHKEVAKQLDISPVTVRNFLQRIYTKLEINDKAELAALFVQTR